MPKRPKRAEQEADVVPSLRWRSPHFDAASYIYPQSRERMIDLSNAQ